MATRTFCDHCGSTIRSPVKYIFGPGPRITYMSVPQMCLHAAQYGGAGAAGGILPCTAISQAISQTTLHENTVTIDLCPTCEKVWMERVKALCRASDV